jgi:hypothetical protein
MTLGFVYAIGAEGHNLVKIGWAISPDARLFEFQRGSPLKLEIFHTRAFTQKIPQLAEAEAHEHLASFRAHGEWFSADRETVISTINKIEDTKMKPLTFGGIQIVPDVLGANDGGAASLILAHKRALKAAQMRRWRAKRTK